MILRGVEKVIVFAMPATGLTVTVTVSKDGGAFAASTNSPAEIASGFYKITLTATEMGAEVVALRITATGYDDQKVILYTVPLIDGKDFQAALQYIAAAAAGKLSGAGTATEVFKGLDGSTTRLTATVDADGNRSAITYG